MSTSSVYAPAATAVPQAPRVRDALVDNVRAVLIVCVVLGHVLMTYHDDSRAVAYAHYFVYLFHMPAFALLSGFVISSASRSARRAVGALLPLYLAFSVVHMVARHFFFGGWGLSIFVAPGLLWYLLSLLCWRLVLPLWDRLRFPIATALVLSVLVGLTDRIGITLSLSRTVVFFPFFLMGFYANRGLLDRVRRLPAVVAPLALVPVAVVAYLATTRHWVRLGLLAGNRPYSQIDGPTWAEMLGRLVAVGCTVLVLVALVRLLPAHKTFFTYVGVFSLTVYVLHMNYVYALQVWHPHLGDDPLVAALLLLSPVAVAFALASPPVRTVVAWIERGAKAVLSPLVRQPRNPEETA